MSVSLRILLYGLGLLISLDAVAQESISEIIKEKNLNRVVVASCTPRTHEPIFQDTIRQVGLNFYLFELANIRDQCSWVHRDFPGRLVRLEAGPHLGHGIVLVCRRLWLSFSHRHLYPRR